MNLLCIIPARGGSKRIPKKNIKSFLGKPIITYSIEAACKSGLFNEIMTSTDDKEIASISIRYGAVVPFYRTKETSDDATGLAEVLLEVLSCYEEEGNEWDYLCCLLPTAPLITSEDLCKAHTLFMKSNADAVLSVVRFSYPIQRALKIDENRIVKMVQPDYYEYRSQDLPPRFHDAGQFYFIKTDILKNEKKMFPNKSLGYELPELQVQDIDTLQDWKLAELKYQLVDR